MMPSPNPPRVQRAPPVADSKWREVQARWETLRPKVAAYWPRLPADEVKRLDGDRASLVQLLRRHYAAAASAAEAQVDAWVAGVLRESEEGNISPPPAQTKDEQRAEGEGMGTAPGAATPHE